MGDVSTEPSMEDILSSIKRIIAEEGDGPSAPARVRKPIRTGIEAVPVSIDDTGMDDDEILELSDPVPSPKAAASTVRRSADPILSSKTAEASRGALESLSRMIVKPDEAGSDTLEGLVREMLRPMLREWLDANLPELVEQMVAREIARITGQAG